MPALEVSPYAAIATALGVGNLIQWWLGRPAQKSGEQQALLNSMIQSSQATPALIKQAQELLNANAGLQDTILSQKNTIEGLGDRISALEKNVESLTSRCEELTRQADRVPTLEGRVGELERAVRDRDAVIADRDAALIARDELLAAKDEKISDLNTMLLTASAGQQLAEGVSKQASAQVDRLLTTLCPSPEAKG